MMRSNNLVITINFFFVAALFDLLVKMVSQPVTTADLKLSAELISLASSCLLSLVVALGETDKLLSAIAALLITPSDMSGSSLKV